MEFRFISDYLPNIEPIYYLSEYGDIYSKVKSYNGSYKINVHTINGEAIQLSVTKMIKPYLNTSITKRILTDLWIINGEPYVKRYLSPDGGRYIRVMLYLVGHKKRIRYQLHSLVNFIYNSIDLDTHHLDTHHLDRNKLNNHYTNLISISRSDHKSLHKYEDYHNTRLNPIEIEDYILSRKFNDYRKHE